MNDDVEKIDRQLREYKPPLRSKKILHISDLHFGSKYADRYHVLLAEKLASVVPQVNKIVITGDLFDNPKKQARQTFQAFRAELRRMTQKDEDPIVIPGNHDQRWMGNRLWIFGKRLDQLVDLQWSRLVIDNQLQTVFFCFDSARHGNWARGSVSREQMIEMGAAFEQACNQRPEVRRFLSIALIHHHPFSFKTAEFTFLERTMLQFGISDETFLQMEDAEEFVTWCARRGVSAILHGHKHVAHDAVRRVNIVRGGGTVQREIRAIGCGSSLGMDGTALSFDVVTWDERSGKWGVSFFSDPGDGSGFDREYVALTEVESPILN
jgi:3',5'-cyclic AMP phosphodiesterase CpdA